MKFCAECGSRLPIGIVESCPNCGTSLWVNITSGTNIVAAAQQSAEYIPLQQTPSSSFDELGKEDGSKEEFRNLTIKIQETIGQILKNMEHSTETETKLVEYKNYRKARSTSISINLSPDPKLKTNILGIIDISL